MSSTISFGGVNSGIQTGINNGTINNHAHVTDPLDKLPIAHGAKFNSYADQHEDECLPGTRDELLESIEQWVLSPHGKCIYWLNGMAGTGKSTISRTVARSFRQQDVVTACFFFKRGEEDRGNARKLFSTITRQLAASVPGIVPSLHEIIESDPDIAAKSMREQWTTNLYSAPGVVAVVIDALDELQNIGSIQFRIFLTSRPELPIRLGFSKIAKHEYQDLALHEMPEAATTHAITLFFEDRFKMIRDAKNVPIDWPGNDRIQALVKIKLDPEESLNNLLEDRAKYATRMDKTYLPVLMQLLNGHDEEDAQELLQSFQQIVGIIILLAVPLSVNELLNFISIKAREILNLLDNFRSVVNLPSDQNLPVRIFHLSFRDFLVQSKSQFRVNEPAKQREIALNCLKLMRMHSKKDICNLESPGAERSHIEDERIRHPLPPELQYSCRYWTHHFERSQLLHSDIANILLFLRKHFLHWMEAMSLLGLLLEVLDNIDILQKARNGDSIMSDFLYDAKQFVLKYHYIADKAPLQIYCAGLVFAPRTSIIRTEFEPDLPSWINHFPQVNEKWSEELLVLEGHRGGVYSVAFSPNGRLLASGSSDCTARLWDTATGSLVYSVALSPDGQLLVSGSDAVRRWNTEADFLQQSREDNSSNSVLSLAFSPNGRLLASGSEDHMVRLWDTATGALLQTLWGHSDDVWAVTFSPDGRLASGSSDRMLLIWDIETGEVLKSLRGDSSITLVAFLSDRQLASGSHHAVTIWDTATGGLQRTLHGSEPVPSMAFSSDGRLAFGTDYKVIRLWGTATGNSQQTFYDRKCVIESVAFSPNGRLSVSRNRDHTIQLWDTVTGCLLQALDGPTALVSPLAFSPIFSPSGQFLACGSYDSTGIYHAFKIMLWDISKSCLLQILEGDSGLFLSAVFSPDSRLLASGSLDCTVQLWDIATASLLNTLEGHSGGVLSVAISPDSRLLASGSTDCTVRLWDITTGSLLHTLEGHSQWVPSVAFSPAGGKVASSCSYHTVRLWNTVTGEIQETWSSEEGIIQLEFSQDDSLLKVSKKDQIMRASLSFRSKNTNLILNSPSSNLEVSAQFSSDDWLYVNGIKLLWIPPEYRSLLGAFAVHSNMIALGNESGQVSFIGFQSSGVFCN
ncbi:hypothetical protein N7520_005269 [Penicillium odoratum]|uniref:uncharacterized protein n=1 Tax=Penicillium odoratum TaxID=1167516 RepID=UPI002546F842|nr:uncharacterized protein N7520_005269 [Penicillium odoratum]KAJ5765710.1 hypothetical protein N7520_005269 [Penicillium odoratum]